MFAEVIVTRPTHRQPPAGSGPERNDTSRLAVWTYRVPQRLRATAMAGHLVQVPLQYSTTLGIIAALGNISPPGVEPEAIRDIAEILDPLPVVSQKQIELARWIAAEYLSPLSAAMRLMLPPALEERTTIVVSQATAPSQQAAGTPPAQASLSPQETTALEILRDCGGRLRMNTLLRRIRADDAEAILHSLADKGLVDARYALVPPKPAPPRVQWVRLLADDAAVDSALPYLGRASKGADALLVLARHSGPPLGLAELCDLADCSSAQVRALAERGWVEVGKPLPRILDLPGAEPIDLGRAVKQNEILRILAHHDGPPLTMDDLCERASCGSGPVRALAQHGWLEIIETRTIVVLLPDGASSDLTRAPKQAELLALLQARGGIVEMNSLLQTVGASSATIAALEDKGLVQRISEPAMVLLAQPRNLVIERIAIIDSADQDPRVRLILPTKEVLDKVVELRGAEKQRAVLEVLRGATGRVWVGGIYAQTGANLSTLRKLAERGLVTLHAEEHDQPRSSGWETPPRLTADQQTVWQEIEAALTASEETAPFAALLHGVTGSGKTEIYLRALDKILAQGRRAIVLVPEISLTAQTVRRFEARFPGRVAVFHSQLSLGQRYAVWDRVRRGKADIVIGPRSALFAPISRLGLVVVDEAHDDSYKQAEPIPLPPYHARHVARALGQLAGAAVLLGSATPDLVTYFQASRGALRLLELPQRILSPTKAQAAQGKREEHVENALVHVTDSLPPVRIVDLRQELFAGNRSIFSRALQEALHRTLDAGEQAILFLNRRGTATFVLCRDCGYVARCPNCDAPLTFHQLSVAPSEKRSGPRGRQMLECHHCNRREPVPARCPQCEGPRIRFFGLGTERVAETVHQLYPKARLLRWDRDTATGPDHERFLQTFVEQRADVLIGTQMIAKGLDLPLVTLVGVISAETALHLPDYRAAERTFQLLTQVAGRAGRSQRGGQVLIQTYDPEHYAILAAANHDYAGFFQQELALRRVLDYPPFSRLVALRFSDMDADRCRREAERLGCWLAAEIQQTDPRASLIGPAPCFYRRVQGRYRWQIVLRSSDPTRLLRDVALPRGWRLDVDPVTLL